MPLFHNWPYVNLNELNLNWIISKIKGIDETAATVEELSIHLPEYSQSATAAAAAASAAALQAQTATTQANSLQTSCQEYADQAAASATSASDSATDANTYKQACSGYAENTVRYADQAFMHATDAMNAKTAAQGYSSTAQQSASQAASSAANALDYCTRAENAATTEGFTGKSGTMSGGNTSQLIDLPAGDYLLSWQTTDEGYARGLIFARVSGATGSRGISFAVNLALIGPQYFRISATEGDVYLYNNFTDVVDWMIIGFNQGI